MSVVTKKTLISLLILGGATPFFAIADSKTTVGTNACAAVVGSAVGNSCFGENSGALITTGDNNTNIGINAGAANTTRDNNTMIGRNAGALNTASDNTFIGAMAGAANVSGSDNTFIGYLSGALNTATDNTFFGTESGRSNTTGFDNTFMGEETGEFTTTGNSNTFVGENAGQHTTTGEHNTFIGNDSGITSGSSTTVSSYALVGHNNTALGDSSGYDLQLTASRNTLVGSAAGGDIGEAFGNTMLGASSGANTEYADFNTFVGTMAGWDNNRTNSTTLANRNTALGALAGVDNRDGEDNVWIGAFSNSSSSKSVPDAALAESMNSASNSNIWAPTVNYKAGGNNAIYRTTVLGAFAAANDNDSVSLGYGAISDQSNSVTIGSNASGKGRYDTTIGDTATNSGNYAVTMGYQALSTHNEAITIGYGAVSHSDNTAVIGNANTVRLDPAVDGSMSLGKSKDCYYDDDGHDATYEWVCNPLYRFSNVVSQELSAIGSEGEMVELNLWADDGDDFSDQWSLSVDDNSNFAIASYVNSTSTFRSETRVKTDLLVVENNGDVTVSGGLTLNSDKRLKKNINAIDDALTKIKLIDGVTYYWKDELGKSAVKQYGLIAQNVESVIPELVKSDKRGIKSVNYQSLTPVLISAIQEQQKQIDKQTAQIVLQQKQIALLMQSLTAK